MMSESLEMARMVEAASGVLTCLGKPGLSALELRVVGEIEWVRLVVSSGSTAPCPRAASSSSTCRTRSAAWRAGAHQVCAGTRTDCPLSPSEMS